MSRLLVLTLIITLGFLAPASEAQIELKHQYFTGWKYSLNGSEFKNVGFSGTELREIMADNKAAQLQIKKYNDNMVLALFCRIPLWLLGTITILDEFDGDGEHAPPGQYAVLVGLYGSALWFEHNSSNHLRKGVALYNGEVFGLELDYSRPPTTKIGNLSLSFSIGF